MWQKSRFMVYFLGLIGLICLIGGSVMKSPVGNTVHYPGQSEEGQRKQMTRDEMIQLLLRLKEMGLDYNQLWKDPVELERLADQLAAESVYSEAAPGGPATGKQQMVLTPSVGNSERKLELLPSYLEGPEWSAIFTDQLGCSYVDADVPLGEWRAKQKAYFHQALPEYPMLARIWDTYVDVDYKVDEVSRLRAECSALLNKAISPIARSGLQKLIEASDQALQKGMGLSLLAD
jgi:hypothetical protein